MREILFRGKPNNAIMEDDFIYGLLVKQVDLDGKDVLCIQTWERDDEGVSSRVLEVIPSTVGEFTGLTDKNGTKIFEGDIVKCTDKTNGYDFTAVVLFGNPNARYDWGFQLKQISGEKANTDILLWVEMEEGGAFVEIIGNIHDNPELLKGGESE